MATNVIMPVLGMVQDTGRILRWLKRAGETVSQGEILMEVETDKAVQELEAPASGILAQILANEGDEVPVTQVVAVILTPEEYRSGGKSREATPPHPEPARIQPQDSLQRENLAVPIPQPVNPLPEPRYGRILASPKARRLARETHLDLSALRGSGPDGAILARDVESRPAKVPDLTPAHFTLRSRVQAAHFLTWLALLQRATGEEITIPDVLAFIVSRALARHPKINATWQDGRFIPRQEIHLSLAVALEGGMAAAVIPHADRLTAREIARIRRAQSGTARAEDRSEGTFAIRSLGTHRVEGYDAALSGPQAAVLAVGQIIEQAVPRSVAAVFEPVMPLSLTCDSRALEDADGALFLETVAELIEEPLLLLA